MQPRIDQCLMGKQKDSARQKSLTLVEMSSAFVVYGLGIGLSLLAFIIELIISRGSQIKTFSDIPQKITKRQKKIEKSPKPKN